MNLLELKNFCSSREKGLFLPVEIQDFRRSNQQFWRMFALLDLRLPSSLMNSLQRGIVSDNFYILILSQGFKLLYLLILSKTPLRHFYFIYWIAKKFTYSSSQKPCFSSFYQLAFAIWIGLLFPNFQSFSSRKSSQFLSTWSLTAVCSFSLFQDWRTLSWTFSWMHSLFQSWMWSILLSMMLSMMFSYMYLRQDFMIYFFMLKVGSSSISMYAIIDSTTSKINRQSLLMNFSSLYLKMTQLLILFSYQSFMCLLRKAYTFGS